MGTWMDDVVEIEVEIVKLDIIWIWFCDVDGDCCVVYLLGSILDDSGDYFGVFFTEPAEGGGDTTVRLCTWDTTPSFFTKSTRPGLVYETSVYKTWELA
jgi:hypothetical protein